MLAKFGLPFEKATPLVHFLKALKRTRNNAGPAEIGLLIMKGITLRKSYTISTLS